MRIRKDKRGERNGGLRQTHCKSDAAKHFYILALKTNIANPYTSVFIRLDCKYWSADAEKRLRAKMAAAAGH